ARFMEVYAGYLAYTDAEIGRLVDHLKATKQYENTAFFVVIGDNGGSKEGGNNGTIRPELAAPTKDDKGQISELLSRIDEIGRPKTYSNYPLGWAQATNTPFRNWNSNANAEGGTRNPLIVSWPKGLQKTTGVRTQYGHVIDLLPTTLEITGAAAPTEVRNVKQTPVQGTSLAYAFRNAKAANRHTEQYYFIAGNGAIVKDGWKASFEYRPDYPDIFSTYPAPTNLPNNAGKDKWELYDLNADFNERINLADKNPAKLKELQAEFDQQAKSNNVYPLLNWSDFKAKIDRFVKGDTARPAALPSAAAYEKN
ncbi:MAG: sulfatase-like hydrolase/transferase, partial [Caulobacterales bacterium]